MEWTPNENIDQTKGSYLYSLICFTLFDSKPKGPPSQLRKVQGGLILVYIHQGTSATFGLAVLAYYVIN